VATTNLPDGKVGTAIASHSPPTAVRRLTRGRIFPARAKRFHADHRRPALGTPTTNGTFNFTVQVSDALAATAAQPLSVFINILDVTKPTCLITNLTAGQRWSNSVFTVKGTASDNVAVSNVWVQLNNGDWSTATPGNGSTNWSSILNLIPGTNTVAAYSEDTSGNFSTTNQFTLTLYHEPARNSRCRLGTISPNYSNAWLEIGRSYSITSSPAAALWPPIG